jgi:colanic acid/amylovoran biosynthesis glycosyltransferase
MPQQATNTSAPVLAYLVSQYPAVSHTFILREIQGLRRLGLAIQTASVKPPAASANGFTEAEAEEAAATFYVKTRGLGRVFGDHAACFLRRPHRYLAGLGSALHLAGPDLKALAYQLVYFAEAVVIGEWMHRTGARHLHVHFANAACTAALLARKTHGISYSITVHGPDEFYDSRLYHVREKIEGAAFLCCISHFCRSQAMKESALVQWEKMEVCPLGVDPAIFTPTSAPGGAVLQVLCIGTLLPRKGQGILLEAAAKVRAGGRALRVDFVGDGPDRPALESAAARLGISDSVTFHGSLNQDRVRECLKRADVFVLPSFAEGVPVSLMEAMAMEIPCISTSVAGIPELIESGVQGILVPPADPDLLARAIERLLDDSELRQRLGRAGRRKIVESYNLSVNVKRLAGIFERRLAIRPSPTAAERAAAL